jgi:hypothetical protein
MITVIFQGADFNEQRNPQGRGAFDNGFSIDALGFDLDYSSLTIYPYTDPEPDYNMTLARRSDYMNEDGVECGDIAWRIEPEDGLLDKMPEIRPHIGKVYGRVIVTSGALPEPPQVQYQQVKGTVIVTGRGGQNEFPCTEQAAHDIATSMSAVFSTVTSDGQIIYY